jgi:hypothetical protein
MMMMMMIISSPSSSIGIYTRGFCLMIERSLSYKEYFCMYPLVPYSVVKMSVSEFANLTKTVILLRHW